MSLSITRENFDEWMMPVYARRLLFRFVGKARACGISRVKSISTLRAGLRLTRWAMHTRRCAALNDRGEVLAYRERLYQRTGAASGEN